MKLVVARVMMTLATRCMAHHRGEWALAMETEFEVAAEAGDALSFASGCLLGAWREMPAEEEGRFALASHFLAVGVIVPMAALLLSSVIHGFAYLAPEGAGTGGVLGSNGPSFVNYANITGLPLMAILTSVLGVGHLYMAWAMLDRNWERVAALGRIGAAIMATMVIFTGILFIYEACALPQAFAIGIELIAIWALVRWHAELRDTSRHEARAGDQFR
jgi:hypothetical protein